jgi:hypothetical protein
MNRPGIPTPSADLRYGIAFRDATPPVGIFHRFWGAANHDIASGVHRPIRVTASALGASNPDGPACVLVTSDHCLLRPHDMSWMRQQVLQNTNLPAATHVAFSFGHSHSAGHICSHRADQPGGELIAPYLDLLLEQTVEAISEAVDGMVPARATFASSPCQMAANRDFQDPADGQFICGFNPDRQLDLEVQIVRFRSLENCELGSLVSYPCHPTTLAWENSLLSPDYIGAMRDTVEGETGAVCQFLLAPCGDIGPRHGFVGDVEVADSNGRQLGHAALAAWHSLDHVAGDFTYQGPVLSGATLGEWKYQGWGQRQPTTPFGHEQFEVDLPYRDDLRDLETVAGELADWERQGEDADSSKPDRAGTARAMAERCRREVERLEPLPSTNMYPFRVDLLRLGDAMIVLVEGEPYFKLLDDLQTATPGHTILVGVLSDGSRCSYLPTRDSYSNELYQVQVSLLAAGCLETLRDAILERLAAPPAPAA